MAELSDKLSRLHMRGPAKKDLRPVSTACSSDAKRKDKDGMFLPMAAYVCPTAMALVGLFAKSSVEEVRNAHLHFHPRLLFVSLFSLAFSCVFSLYLSFCSLTHTDSDSFLFLSDSFSFSLYIYLPPLHFSPLLSSYLSSVLVLSHPIISPLPPLLCFNSYYR